MQLSIYKWMKGTVYMNCFKSEAVSGFIIIVVIIMLQEHSLIQP